MTGRFYRWTPPLLRADVRGAAAIEMAFALPVLILLMFGIVGYGSWIALGQVVQQGANEAARASVAGLNPAERATLARDAATTTLTKSYALDPADIAVTVNDDGATLTVAVAYDGSRNPLLSLPVIPAPSKTIARRSAVRVVPL